MVTLLDATIEHVRSTRDIKVAALFGSQARTWLRAGHGADDWSDVDLQIVTTRPRDYVDFRWVHAIPGHPARVSALRPVFGGVQKCTILYEAGELDLVVVPYGKLWLARRLFQLGLHRHIPSLKRGLSNFADIMRFEHVVVKGGPAWQRFYADAGRQLPRLGLTDAEAEAAANLAYVDATWVLGRIARGELIAAQRILHLSVIETNVRLLQEWRERRGVPAYHRARRAEAVLPPEELRWVSIDTRREATSLAEATRAAVEGTRQLLLALTNRAPSWPAL